MTAIKVCGLRRAEDVRLCAELGVGLVGFNFWPGSKRHVRVEEAAGLAALLPASVERVGVFVRQPPDEVARAVAAVGLGAVQLHGDEELEPYAGLGVPLLQVLRLAPGAPAPTPSRLAARVLLDAATPGFGGAGVTVDWGLAARLRETCGRDLLLAGGLVPENVGAAIREVRPWGVDVASGVERAPGEKDPARLRAFVVAVREAT